jgi:hypothetical protein
MNALTSNKAPGLVKEEGSIFESPNRSLCFLDDRGVIRAKNPLGQYVAPRAGRKSWYSNAKRVKRVSRSVGATQVVRFGVNGCVLLTTSIEVVN